MMTDDDEYMEYGNCHKSEGKMCVVKVPRSSFSFLRYRTKNLSKIQNPE